VTFTISKSKLAVAIVAAAMLIPSGAMAFHVFDDVPDDKFYADPVEWAFDNGITTGKTPSTFAPDDNVTRGETVTFLKRYEDNIVAPADLALQADIDDNADDIAANTAAIDDNADDIAALPEIMWAVTNADASLDRSSGGVTTSKSGTGTYFIDFPRDITDCAMTGNASLSGSSNTEDPHMVTVVGRAGNPNSIYLTTFDPSGTLSDAGTHVVVTCPPQGGLIIVPLDADESATLPGNLAG